MNHPLPAGGVKLALLCNPRSGRVRKRKHSAVHCFAESVAASLREASTPGEIGVALDSLLQEGPDLLAIAGGDGTVQAALTHMLAVHAPSALPPLCIIPAGTTNMTALDLGVDGGLKRCLQTLQQHMSEPHADGIVRRRVLRVQRPGCDDLYGLFFGAGAIASGVRYFHENISRIGMTGELAGGLVLLWLLGGLLLGRAERALQPATLTVSGTEGNNGEGSYIIVLASTLDRLLLGMRPYWGGEAAPIRVTLVCNRPQRFWRSLPSLLRGRGDRLEGLDGYDSFNTGVLELHMDNEFIIDGELFGGTAAGPVRITSTEPVAFLVP